MGISKSMLSNMGYYALVAGGSFALAYNGPIDWRFWVGMGMAGIVAAHAKQSPGKDSTQPPSADVQG